MLRARRKPRNCVQYYNLARPVFFGVYASLVMVAVRPHQLLDVGENATKNGTLRLTHLLLY